ncbi:phosphatase PAP2 family protein [Actinophytocola xanthii]|uniref:Phosphatase PAP2 family protein n=1 Tax=Actinophytocola xanthii TaxID=1912961 RepID=A0A1Q8CRP1_9PSEU|nr:phosphatase PAP2 family protein [Actinophytocola xanthii]OLF16994.1 phosphatase PAP2 family protein [Actinophytocola xanthii]
MAATATQEQRQRAVEPGTPPPEPERSVEIAALARVQHTLGSAPAVRAARGLSLFGEHAAGWFALGLLGAAVDRGRRRDWLAGAAGVVAAHGAAIAVKRVVRRQRPIDESVRVLVKTPSSLSFPSSHATSTTAAAVVYSGLTGRNLVPALVPPMLVSRLVLGVHYPTDVLAGSALGAAVGGLVRRSLRNRRGNRRRTR